MSKRIWKGRARKMPQDTYCIEDKSGIALRFSGEIGVPTERALEASLLFLGSFLPIYHALNAQEAANASRAALIVNVHLLPCILDRNVFGSVCSRRIRCQQSIDSLAPSY